MRWVTYQYSVQPRLPPFLSFDACEVLKANYDSVPDTADATVELLNTFQLSVHCQNGKVSSYGCKQSPYAPWMYGRMENQLWDSLCWKARAFTPYRRIHNFCCAIPGTRPSTHLERDSSISWLPTLLISHYWVWIFTINRFFKLWLLGQALNLAVAHATLALVSTVSAENIQTEDCFSKITHAEAIDTWLLLFLSFQGA